MIDYGEDEGLEQIQFANSFIEESGLNVIEELSPYMRRYHPSFCVFSDPDDNNEMRIFVDFDEKDISVFCYCQPANDCGEFTHFKYCDKETTPKNIAEFAKNLAREMGVI